MNILIRHNNAAVHHNYTTLFLVFYYHSLFTTIMAAFFGREGGGEHCNVKHVVVLFEKRFACCISIIKCHHIHFVYIYNIQRYINIYTDTDIYDTVGQKTKSIDSVRVFRESKIYVSLVSGNKHILNFFSTFHFYSRYAPLS